MWLEKNVCLFSQDFPFVTSLHIVVVGVSFSIAVLCLVLGLQESIIIKLAMRTNNVSSYALIVR